MHPMAFSESVRRAAARAGMTAALSRRGFLRFSASALAGMAALGLNPALGAEPPLVVLDNPKGVVLADPARCIGCQRCELACTEGNDDVARPSAARIRVDRALHFGPDGPGGPEAGAAMLGAWGGGVVVQGVCRQCPPPAPCVAACPEGAIAPEPETGAWMVDEARCTGCGQCVEACPWHVMTFDQERQVASKCFLCHGRPRCVAACPAGALRYVPWTDLTHPVRVPTPSPTPAPTSGPKA